MSDRTAPIVVGVDGSQAALIALDWAAAEAERVGCPLRVVHAWRPYPYEVGSPTALELAEQVLQAAKERLADRDVEVTAEACVGAPRWALLREAENARALVVGRRGAGRLVHLVMGSTSLAVATHSEVPVVVIPERWEPPAELRGKIVVGVDGSPRSQPAVEHAFQQAADRGATLTAVLAVDFLGAAPEDAEIPKTIRAYEDEIREKAEKDLADALAPWREKYPEVEVEAIVEMGNPTNALHRHAADADLLVIGSRGHGVITGMLLGSIARTVLYMADVPAVVVRS